jgi:hypothetical protein
MGNFLVKISNLEQFGGIYNNEIYDFFGNIFNTFYKNKNGFDKIKFESLGGVYFIRDNNNGKEEFYKIGKGNYLTKSKLIGRIESYGTYYPFGIRIRGIVFTLSNNQVDYLKEYKELKNILFDYHLKNDKEALIKKYYNNYSKETELTNTYFLNKIMHIYATRIKNDKIGHADIIQTKLLSDLIGDMFTNSLEKELHYQILTKYQESKGFIKKIFTRENYGEFFKIKSSDLLKTYLSVDGIDNQLLIYFPNDELIFGQYNTSQNKGKDYTIYLGSNELMKGKF